MTNEKLFYSFDAQAGRPAILILANCLPPLATTDLIEAFAAHLQDFSTHDVDILLLVSMQSTHMLAYNEGARDGIRVVFCVADFFQAPGLGSQHPSILIIDKDLRVLGHITQADKAQAVQSALRLVADVAVETPRDILLPAPVLLIPNILSSDLCRDLIAHFEISPHSDGGMASMDSAGNAFHKIDHAKKKREDCVITPADRVHDQVLDLLARRCLPEIKKAFQFEAFYTDRILIARYDDNGGCFLRHRDNIAPSVAFRQFAISINLNADYEGGYLLFPEFNAHRYRPPLGGGLVFSASLLHEATAVTRGSRYVLLTFFHNKDAELQRASMLTGADTARYATAT